MAKSEKILFALLVFLLMIGLGVKLYQIRQERSQIRWTHEETAADESVPSRRELKTKRRKTLRALNLNQASVEDLASHSYISKGLAQKIVDYRNTHGPFKSATDLLHVDGVSVSFYKKLEPYLALQ